MRRVVFRPAGLGWTGLLVTVLAVGSAGAGSSAGPRPGGTKAGTAEGAPARFSTGSSRISPDRFGMPADSQDWPRFGRDVGRSNAPPVSMGVTAVDVGSMRRQRIPIDGTVDASAIYLAHVTIGGAAHDAFFVTTTYGKTLAIDADDGSILWRYTPPGYDGWAGSAQITTATPVADPDRRFIYAASPDGRIQKLAVADGRPAWRTAITELPRREKIASSLNYLDGKVIATTGGYIGDAPPYQGHVAILDASSGRLLHVWNSLCSDRTGLLDPRSCDASGSAIWGRAGAVLDSASGTIFVATGNGPWDGHTDWGDAVVELSPDATRMLGNYTPSDTHRLDVTDLDLGSTSPVLFGSGLVAQGGKDGRIRLLDWSSMRGTDPHRGGEEGSVPTPGGTDLFTAPAVLRTDTATWLFAADGRGTAAWTVEHGELRPAWHDGHAGTSPVVVDGLLFVYDPGGGLRVYRASTGERVVELACGSGHWNSPIVADGRIALPEGNANDHRTSGILDIWRLP